MYGRDLRAEFVSATTENDLNSWSRIQSSVDKIATNPGKQKVSPSDVRCLGHLRCARCGCATKEW